MFAGYTKPADIIYKGYGIVCHQLAFRSFFIGGEQYVYPRAAAGIESLRSLQEATGLSEDNRSESIYIAHEYIGNHIVGYKIALCQRDLAIYLSMLLFGIIFGITGRKMPPLNWILWVMLGLAPIGLDGLSQLLSQPPFNFFPYRESTPFLRVLTGSLFGFMTAWFGYPLVEITMLESKEIMTKKYARLHDSIQK